MRTERLRVIITWEYSGLCLLLLIVIALHFITIMQPMDFAFDEKYYVPAASDILQGTGIGRPEHPPLGQLLIASGILLFGDNPFGWRILSVTFGALCVVLFYLICRELNLSKASSFLATSLLATENLSFTLASVAMLDVYSLAFMLLSFWFYLKGWYLKAGLAVGLATLAKLSGSLALPIILLHWLFTRRDKKPRFTTAIGLSIVSFVALLPLFDLAIRHRLIDPIDHVRGMLTLIANATFGAYAMSPFGAQPTRPWEWLINRDSIACIKFDITTQQFYIVSQLTISPLIWALIIPSILFMVVLALRRNNAAIFALAWFASSYLFWIPVTLITDRLTYIYYFYPTMGAVCIGLAQGIIRLLGTRGITQFITIVVILGYLMINLYMFVALVPGILWAKILCVIPLYIVYFYYSSKVRPRHISII